MRLAMFLVPFAVTACTTDTTPGGKDGSSPSWDNHVSTTIAALCPPPATFDNAVCICEDLENIGALQVEPGPGGAGSIGVNGHANLSGGGIVSGNLIAWAGADVSGASIGDSFVTTGDVTGAGSVTISGDATIGGDLDFVGAVSIGGNLALGGAESVSGYVSAGNRTSYAAPAAPPCGCDPSTFFDVDGAVATAAQVAGGASSWGNVGASEIHLSGGNYFVTADMVGARRIFVDAPSSVYVDGNLRSVGADLWTLAPGATLDLFVSGNVTSVGALSIGNAADPTAFRLYIGGGDDVTVGTIGAAEISGAIYAPRATLAYAGATRITGTIFAKRIVGSGALSVVYGDSSTPPTSCDPQVDTDDDGDEDSPSFL